MTFDTVKNSFGGGDPTPDLTRKVTKSLSYADQSGLHETPYTVPCDGWIVLLRSGGNPISFWIKIDDVPTKDYGPRISGSYVRNSDNSGTQMIAWQQDMPWPVKKGQVIADTNSGANAQVTFAPCKGSTM